MADPGPLRVVADPDGQLELRTPGVDRDRDPGGTVGDARAGRLPRRRPPAPARGPRPCVPTSGRRTSPPPTRTAGTDPRYLAPRRWSPADRRTTRRSTRPAPRPRGPPTRPCRPPAAGCVPAAGRARGRPRAPSSMSRPRRGRPPTRRTPGPRRPPSRRPRPAVRRPRGRGRRSSRPTRPRQRGPPRQSSRRERCRRRTVATSGTAASRRRRRARRTPRPPSRRSSSGGHRRRSSAATASGRARPTEIREWRTRVGGPDGAGAGPGGARRPQALSPTTATTATAISASGARDGAFWRARSVSTTYGRSSRPSRPSSPTSRPRGLSGGRNHV